MKELIKKYYDILVKINKIVYSILIVLYVWAAAKSSLDRSFVLIMAMVFPVVLLMFVVGEGSLYTELSNLFLAGATTAAAVCGLYDADVMYMEYQVSDVITSVAVYIVFICAVVCRYENRSKVRRNIAALFFFLTIAVVSFACYTPKIRDMVNQRTIEDMKDGDLLMLKNKSDKGVVLAVHNDILIPANELNVEMNTFVLKEAGEGYWYLVAVNGKVPKANLIYYGLELSDIPDKEMQNFLWKPIDVPNMGVVFQMKLGADSFPRYMHVHYFEWKGRYGQMVPSVSVEALPWTGTDSSLFDIKIFEDKYEQVRYNLISDKAGTAGYWFMAAGICGFFAGLAALAVRSFRNGKKDNHVVE